MNRVHIPIADMNPKVPETLHRYQRGFARVTTAATAKRTASSELLNGRIARTKTGHDEAHASLASMPAVFRTVFLPTTHALAHSSTASSSKSDPRNMPSLGARKTTAGAIFSSSS